MKIARPTKSSPKQTKELDDIRRATSHLLKDLDEERAALAIIKAKEEALLESIGDGVVATDQNGVTIVLNKSATAMLGWRDEDVIGKKWQDMVRIEDEAGVTTPITKLPLLTALKTGTTTTGNINYFIRKNGTRFPVAFKVTPIKLDNKIIGAVGVFRDITKEKELDKAKDEFISLASHQLNSPITATIWGLDVLLGEDAGALNKEQKEMLEKILERSKNMAELVSGFLAATKMESSGFSIEKEKVDLLSICDSVLEELAKPISDKKITLIKKYGKNVPPLDIGTKTARIILQNLLTNAIKYTPQKGAVEVKIEKIAEEISIIVKDNGYGIPEEAKSRIFTKLFRADNVKEKEPLGTGLGLYLLKSLIDKLGGKVWFKSKEGVGTTFYVNLKSTK